jgi:hypothetical protein
MPYRGKNENPMIRVEALGKKLLEVLHADMVENGTNMATLNIQMLTLAGIVASTVTTATKREGRAKALELLDTFEAFADLGRVRHAGGPR